jgi:2-polyprenyl-3-methyl-5-hydroxy-6-metoxy-1,4-benzoquinol methylase
MINELSREVTDKSVLDVGAGPMPFKAEFESLGFNYKSHDFNSYNPSQVSSSGLQNSTWEHPPHDFVCDILEIPLNEEYGLVICTECLEHVPDPVAAFDRLVKLTAKTASFSLRFRFCL